MNAQQLRNSILQEAIEGRLVPQDPNDEPASALLERIREEKRRLVKEGKLKKKDLVETPIPEDEKPFEIPESWEWVRWGELSESIQYGYNAPAKEKGRIKMVRISDIQNGRIVWETTPYCDIEESEIENYLLKKNDILFARTGGTVGKSYLVNEVSNEAIYAGYLIRTRYSNQLCAKYLKLFMESSLYWAQLKEGTIATAQPNCNGQKLSKMILPLPPLAEQKRIVAKIEELMPKVEEYGKAQEALDKLNAELPEKLKKSILQEAIEGRLVPQDPNDEPASALLERIREEKRRLVKEGKLKKKDLVETPIPEDEKPFEIPESWEWCRIKTIASKLVDGDHNPPRGLSYDTGYYMLSSKNINHNKVVNLSEARYLSYEDWQKCNERTQLTKGDILLTTVATLGRSCVYENDIPYCFQRSVSVVQTYIFNYFLKYCFDSPYYQSQIDDKATGTAQRGFYLNQLEDSIIPLPPLSEQQRIVAKIEELFARIDNMKI